MSSRPHESRSGPGVRILGLDPGSRTTGYGVIELSGDSLQLVTCGVIRTSAARPFAARLQEIYDCICEVITNRLPAIAAVEEVFMARNPMSALKLGHARGVILLAAGTQGLDIHEYSARKVKQTVTGYGNAEKAQVQQMVRILLKLAASPSEDAADALAVALCHAHHLRFLSTAAPVPSICPSPRPENSLTGPAGADGRRSTRKGSGSAFADK